MTVAATMRHIHGPLIRTIRKMIQGAVESFSLTWLCFKSRSHHPNLIQFSILGEIPVSPVQFQSYRDFRLFLDSISICLILDVSILIFLYIEVYRRYLCSVLKTVWQRIGLKISIKSIIYRLKIYLFGVRCCLEYQLPSLFWYSHFAANLECVCFANRR